MIFAKKNDRHDAYWWLLRTQFLAEEMNWKLNWYARGEKQKRKRGDIFGFVDEEDKLHTTGSAKNNIQPTCRKKKKKKYMIKTEIIPKIRLTGKQQMKI